MTSGIETPLSKAIAERRIVYNQHILPTDCKLVIVMVGLPARGKSYMAKKIFRYLRHLKVHVKIFNFGSYRRVKTTKETVGKASANFFDPQNDSARKIREQCAIDAMSDMVQWCKGGGQVGILDGTNSNTHRRKLIRTFYKKASEITHITFPIIYVESLCHNASIVRDNIVNVKLKNPDYCTMDPDKALADFYQRIKMYEKQYEPVSKNEGTYIKVIDVGNEVTGHEIRDWLALRIFYFLMHLNLHYVTKNTKPAVVIPAPGSWMRRQSYLLWVDQEDTYKDEKKANNKAEDEKPSTQTGPSPVLTLGQKHSNVIPEDAEDDDSELGPFEDLDSKESTLTFQSDDSLLQPAFKKATRAIQRQSSFIAFPGSGGSNPSSPRSQGLKNRRFSFGKDKEKNEASSDPSSDKAECEPKTFRVIRQPTLKQVLELQTIQVQFRKGEIKMGQETPVVSNDDLISDDQLEQYEYCGVQDCPVKFKAGDIKYVCGQCCRVVCEEHSSLVTEKDHVENLVRICQICLYETDSDSEEDDIKEFTDNAETNISDDVKDALVSDIDHIIEEMPQLPKEDVAEKLQDLIERIRYM